jgi:hypothetical protein
MIEIVEKPKQHASHSEILELEAALGGTLPSDYRDFLLKTNGGFSDEYLITFPDWLYPSQEEGLGLIAWGGLCADKPFFELRRVLKNVASQIPAGLLPFVEATSNHLLLLSVCSSDRGSIYAYNPELEGDESLRFVAPSFSALCEKLRLTRRRGDQG